MSILDSLTQGLLIGLGLFYKALWPILLGVLITALIETLIDQERLAGILGGRDLLSTGKATAAGVASSACTFGALSITQTLFKRAPPQRPRSPSALLQPTWSSSWAF